MAIHGAVGRPVVWGTSSGPFSGRMGFTRAIPAVGQSGRHVRFDAERRRLAFRARCWTVGRLAAIAQAGTCGSPLTVQGVYVHTRLRRGMQQVDQGRRIGIGIRLHDRQQTAATCQEVGDPLPECAAFRAVCAMGGMGGGK